MSGRRMVERLAGAAPWLGAVALLSALWAHRSALDAAHARAAELEGPAQRSFVADRLVGANLSDVRLPALDGEEEALLRGGGWELIWFVDPSACPDCLGRTAGWREALRRPGLAGTVVLTGVTLAEAGRVRRGAGLEGRVLADPDGRHAESVGLDGTTPAVFALVDGSGTVVLAEARRTSKSCAWSFPRQAAALVAGGDAGRLR